MQTFLPYPDFRESAKCLDRLRLGKQRVECKQILTANVSHQAGVRVGWQNHPATLMWRGHDKALAIYASEMSREWIRRGYNDSLLPYFESFTGSGSPRVTYPKWYRDNAVLERVCSSHRSNLLRKNELYYSDFDWTETNDIPYYWPI